MVSSVQSGTRPPKYSTIAATELPPGLPAIHTASTPAMAAYFGASSDEGVYVAFLAASSRASPSFLAFSIDASRASICSWIISSSGVMLEAFAFLIFLSSDSASARRVEGSAGAAWCFCFLLSEVSSDDAPLSASEVSLVTVSAHCCIEVLCCLVRASRTLGLAASTNTSTALFPRSAALFRAVTSPLSCCKRTSRPVHVALSI
mmetsp:Transcript_13401/g.26439  ORF Transcript_13401/g.26439 Transcript_13401/m.26439 type:complete len:204 (-) Transcript_13401:549-1160(-)